MEQSDEANCEIKIRLLRLRLAMTHQTEGEGDKGGGLPKNLKGIGLLKINRMRLIRNMRYTSQAGGLTFILLELT